LVKLGLVTVEDAIFRVTSADVYLMNFRTWGSGFRADLRSVRVGEKKNPDLSLLVLSTLIP
jgi:hypothetical protein